MIEEDTFINKRRWSDIEVKFVNLFQAIKFFEIDICLSRVPAACTLLESWKRKWWIKFGNISRTKNVNELK